MKPGDQERASSLHSCGYTPRSPRVAHPALYPALLMASHNTDYSESFMRAPYGLTAHEETTELRGLSENTTGCESGAKSRDSRQYQQPAGFPWLTSLPMHPGRVHPPKVEVFTARSEKGIRDSCMERHPVPASMQHHATMSLRHHTQGRRELGVTTMNSSAQSAGSTIRQDLLLKLNLLQVYLLQDASGEGKWLRQRIVYTSQERSMISI